MARVLGAKDVDDSILEQAVNPDNGTLKVRIQPYVLKDSEYVSWKGVSWILECTGPDEALELREVLRLTLAAWAKYEFETVKQALEF